MASPNTTSDMAQFFDFGEATVSESPQQATENSLAAFTQPVTCPAHGNNDCLCHGLYDHNHDIVLEQDLENGIANQPDWNPDFSNWIPRYHKPAQPCDYCRSKSLECFIYNSNGSAVSVCSPCNALFRPCSFSDPEKMHMQKSRTALDTLDMVAENEERCVGGLTGKKQMRSLGHMGPIVDEGGDIGPKKGAAAARFPRTSIKILKDWIVAHIDHPYPTDEQKETLKAQTGLNISQISNWMANTRRRQKARPKRSSSPSIRPSTEAIDIPAGRTWDDLNPFERWKHSPPENEPAPMTAIAQAVEQFDLPAPGSSSSSYRKEGSNDTSSNFSALLAPSTTSLETGFTNMSSGSLNSAWSHGSRNSFGSLNSLKSRERRRRRRVPSRASRIDADAAPRLFQCTFCCDRFKSKYDWSRHEKTLHLSLEKWICAPIGEVITIASTGKRKCVYCDTVDPSKEHLETHHYRACEEKGLEARTFYRKDHLRQHLRLMHDCKMTPTMETWKSEVQLINCRCGFCGVTFTKWQDRVDHLAKEFRNGATMKDWKGCRGLDSQVAAHVVNAMPPYLIANESMSPFPFSASNSSSIKVFLPRSVFMIRRKELTRNKKHNLDLDQTDLEFLLPTDGCPGPVPDANGVFVPYIPGNRTTDGSSPPSHQSYTNVTTSVSPSPHLHATCWEILTLRLGRFARRHIEQHGANTITDKLLQQQAREILYESDDPWNQTAADNVEWLNLFKKAHGIENTHIRAWKHQDILEDLGISSNAQVDQSFSLDNFDHTIVESAPANFAPLQVSEDEALVYECLLSGTMDMSKLAHHVGGSSNSAFTTPPSTSLLYTPGGITSPLPTTFLTNLSGNLDDPIGEYACSKPFGEDSSLSLGENGELTVSTFKGRRTLRNTTDHLSIITSSISMPPPPKPTTTTASSVQDSLGLLSWEQNNLGPNFGTSAPPPPHTTAGLGASVAASAAGMSMEMGLGRTVNFGGNSQVWDDSELDFALDMDMDMDMNMKFSDNPDMDLTGLDELLL
ncbi:hypothetical protein K504DRAFT_461160 [Pleomassaria siparia CBS 279.74]|uniref:Uncharacterized protein n=1 Tax=Pleomassaria siparia CBS 279.74 TaxID=1314801 RepID=A0A6G1JUW7_9PLEO|nr:hypothetical protein K504DRAFT_461160 [Pleomassaria siparia CBS 279.74]